jgi:ABC-2 type transport system permease protein
MMRSHTLTAAFGVARRHLKKWITVPSNFLPTFLFPLIFFAGFAGALGRVGEVPGFTYQANYVSWIYVFSLLQTCMFGGLATGFTIAGDFDSGFARRLMLAVPDRRAILLGYIISTAARAAIMSGIVTIVALVAGLEVPGGLGGLCALLLLAWSMSVCGTLWAAGVMFRARNPALGPAMQIPMFIIIFLAPVYVPLALLEGWIHVVATVNPVTYVMGAGRGLLVGDGSDVWIALAAIGGMLAVLTIWALTGVRSAERAGG